MRWLQDAACQSASRCLQVTLCHCRQMYHSICKEADRCVFFFLKENITNNKHKLWNEMMIYNIIRNINHGRRCARWFAATNALPREPPTLLRWFGTPTVEPELFNKELLLAFISHRYYLLAIINWWRYYEITNIYHEKCSLLGIMKTMIRKKLYWLASNI